MWRTGTRRNALSGWWRRIWPRMKRPAQPRLVSDFIAEFRGFARSSARKPILEALALERKPLTIFATPDGVDRRQTDRYWNACKTNPERPTR